MYQQPSHLVQPLKPVQQPLLSPQGPAPPIPGATHGAFQSVPNAAASAHHLITSQQMTSPLAMQQIMQQQFSNKVLCQQMVYNAALLSTALNQSNSNTSVYSNPTVLFASQPITAASAASWNSMDTNNHASVAVIEDMSDQKPIFPN